MSLNRLQIIGAAPLYRRFLPIAVLGVIGLVFPTPSQAAAAQSDAAEWYLPSSSADREVAGFVTAPTIGTPRLTAGDQPLSIEDLVSTSSLRLAVNNSGGMARYQQPLVFSFPHNDAKNAFGNFGGRANVESWQQFAQQGDGQLNGSAPQGSQTPASNGQGDDYIPPSPLGATSATAATDQLDLALGQRGVYSDLISLQDRIYDAQQPVANAVSRYSTQSDNLNIFWEEVSQDIFFSDGADRLRPGLQYISYSPKVGNGVLQYSAGSDGTYRFSDSAALSGDFWLNDVQPKSLHSDIIPTYDLFVTLWPSDFVRVDVDSKREIFDNVTSLQMGINAESVGGSVDFTPNDRLRFSVRGTGSFYSDTNDKQFGEAEAVWKAFTGPTIEVGVRASGFHFSKLLNDGYFNPSSYESGEAVFRLQTDLTDQLNVELAASGGVENAEPGGTKPLVKSSLQVVYKLLDHWNLDAGISYFSSQDSNSSGFARTSYTLGLHYKFD